MKTRPQPEFSLPQSALQDVVSANDLKKMAENLAHGIAPEFVTYRTTTAAARQIEARITEYRNKATLCKAAVLAGEPGFSGSPFGLFTESGKRPEIVPGVAQDKEQNNKPKGPAT